MRCESSANGSEEGFDGLARHLPESCVKYVLFVIDDRPENRRLLSVLDKIRKAANELCRRLTKDYIWQRDALQLELKTQDGLVYLQGTTYFGDSVEDEWLIVYLLRELTRSFQNLWVHVFDSDGEFLLIEAANVLPAWLSPEMDGNRVWMHRAKLKIIPLPADLQDKRPLPLTEAISLIENEPDRLVHSALVEAEAFYRLQKYPGQIKDSIHHSLVTIPRKLASILHEKPAAISPAVEAFYLRDTLSMKPLLSGNSRELRFPPEDLVTVSVKFTKVLFAQTKSQRFAPPPVWASVLENVETSTTGTGSSSSNLTRLEMGMKVTSGFEMLAINAETKDSRTAREVAIIVQDVEDDGPQCLPTDAVIQSWPDSNRDDDETWLDINYEDLEKELDGDRSTRKGGSASGFGDASAHADLQKIVARFESFLNDETAGFEGAELDDMDEDNDDPDDSEDDSEEEDKEVSFDEDQFTQMMREMMGMPVDEDQEITQLASQMKAELDEYGALRLDARSEKGSQRKLKPNSRGNGATGVHKAGCVAREGEESGDDEVEVDFNLAENLLASFKSQAGTAGPASNILGMMGLKLPRDEDEDEDEGP